MKMPRHAPAGAPNRQAQQGLAMIVVIAILAILFVYVADNAHTLSQLKREVKLIERQQTNRLAHSSILTNSASAAPSQAVPAGR